MFSLAENALRVEAIDLWIDSMRARERCYVSHGHSDHAREHGVVVATRARPASAACASAGAWSSKSAPTTSRGTSATTA